MKLYENFIFFTLNFYLISRTWRSAPYMPLLSITNTTSISLLLLLLSKIMKIYILLLLLLSNFMTKRKLKKKKIKILSYLQTKINKNQ